MPLGTVHDRDQRLRRQRLELGRQLARPLGQRLPGVEVREQLLELARPPLAASRRPTSPASRRARAAARRGRGRRRAARASASRGRRPERACRRSRRARRAARRPGAGCRAARARCPGTSTTRIAAGVTLRACTTVSASCFEPRVRDRGHPDVSCRSRRLARASAPRTASSCRSSAARRSRPRAPRAQATGRCARSASAARRARGAAAT